MSVSELMLSVKGVGPPGTIADNADIIESLPELHLKYHTQ